MKKIIGIALIIVLGISCNSPTSPDTPDTPPNYASIITSNVEETSAVYINLADSSETTQDGTWQISFQMLTVTGSGFSMSNLVINPTPGTTMAALYDDRTFDEITSVPTTFSSPPYSDALADLTSVQYGGSNEMISYAGPPTHSRSIVTNKVLLIYSMSTHKIWKIQFVEYNEGVILFKFSEL